MKITVISSTVFAVGQGGSPLPGYGGLEAIAWLQAKGLAAKGHEVTLVAPDGSVCQSANVFHTGPAGQHDERMAYSKFWQHLAMQDVIADHSWAKWSYIGKQEGWLKAPVLGWMHAPVDTMYKALPPVEKPCIVCISEDQRSHFEALFGRPARTCLNGIDLDFYKPMGIQRSDRFLFLARFSSIKSPDVCQDVCNICEVGLDLVGDTSITNEPEYFEMCKKKADGQRIRIIGGVSRGESVGWFSSARSLLHLTRNFREPFGLAPVEAMACGCPVLGWRYGALKETVREGVSGFLVSSVDEAISVIKSGAMDGIDRKQCREWASQFSIQRMVDRCEELCKESVETGGW